MGIAHGILQLKEAVGGEVGCSDADVLGDYTAQCADKVLSHRPGGRLIGYREDIGAVCHWGLHDLSTADLTLVSMRYHQGHFSRYRSIIFCTWATVSWKKSKCSNNGTIRCLSTSGMLSFQLL